MSWNVTFHTHDLTKKYVQHDVMYNIQHIRMLWWQGEAGSSNELEQLENFVSILVCLEFNFSIW